MKHSDNYWTLVIQWDKKEDPEFKDLYLKLPTLKDCFDVLNRYQAYCLVTIEKITLDDPDKY